MRCRPRGCIFIEAFTWPVLPSSCMLATIFPSLLGSAACSCEGNRLDLPTRASWTQRGLQMSPYRPLFQPAPVGSPASLCTCPGWWALWSLRHLEASHSVGTSCFTGWCIAYGKKKSLSWGEFAFPNKLCRFIHLQWLTYYLSRIFNSVLCCIFFSKMYKLFCVFFPCFLTVYILKKSTGVMGGNIFPYKSL